MAQDPSHAGCAEARHGRTIRFARTFTRGVVIRDTDLALSSSRTAVRPRSERRLHPLRRAERRSSAATRRLRDAMTARRCSVTEVEGQGGHAPMQDGEIDEAMRWMKGP